MTGFRDIKLISDGKGKYSIIGTFEIGESGEFERRVLCTTTKKKGEALVLKMERGEI
jgi:hypothetical protein